MELSTLPDFEGVHTPWFISLHQFEEEQNKYLYYEEKRNHPWLLDLQWELNCNNAKPVEQDDIERLNAWETKKALPFGEWTRRPHCVEKLKQENVQSLKSQDCKQQELLSQNSISSDDLLYPCSHFNPQEMNQIYERVKTRKQEKHQIFNQKYQAVATISKLIAQQKQPTPQRKNVQLQISLMEIGLMRGSFYSPEIFFDKRYESAPSRFRGFKISYLPNRKERLKRKLTKLLTAKKKKTLKLIGKEVRKIQRYQNRLLKFIESPIG